MRTLAALLLILLLTVLARSDGLYNTSGAYVVGQIPGTATNDNATAGNVGEVIESVITLGTTQSLTTNTDLNVTTISLTAGDWDVRGTTVFTCAATTTVTGLMTSISTATGAAQTAPVSRATQITYASGTVFASVGNGFIPVGPTRLSLAATTSVFLIARANFATSTCSTNGGHIAARRMR